MDLLRFELFQAIGVDVVEKINILGRLNNIVSFEIQLAANVVTSSQDIQEILTANDPELARRYLFHVSVLARPLIRPTRRSLTR